jgi:DNA-binding transcriptional MerR regulator
MTTSNLGTRPIVGTVLFATFAVFVAVVAIVIGWSLYAHAARPATEFYAKLGEISLQLAIVIIIGALVKAMVDWGTSQHSRYREQLEDRKEFLRRVRAMHVTIQNARDLMNAHASARTWGEQSRRLMQLRPEVEEISEDLKASRKLFAKQSQIVDGLEAIVTYLNEAGNEYVEKHSAVDRGHKDSQRLLDTISQENMAWVRNFMEGGDGYKNSYEANLTKSKGAMRAEVHGA